MSPMSMLFAPANIDKNGEFHIGDTVSTRPRMVGSPDRPDGKMGRSEFSVAPPSEKCRIMPKISAADRSLPAPGVQPEAGDTNPGYIGTPPAFQTRLRCPRRRFG